MVKWLKSQPATQEVHGLNPPSGAKFFEECPCHLSSLMHVCVQMEKFNPEERLTLKVHNLPHLEGIQQLDYCNILPGVTINTLAVPT